MPFTELFDEENPNNPFHQRLKKMCPNGHRDDPMPRMEWERHPFNVTYRRRRYALEPKWWYRRRHQYYLVTNPWYRSRSGNTTYDHMRYHGAIAGTTDVEKGTLRKGDLLPLGIDGNTEYEVTSDIEDRSVTLWRDSL